MISLLSLNNALFQDKILGFPQLACALLEGCWYMRHRGIVGTGMEITEWMMEELLLWCRHSFIKFFFFFLNFIRSAAYNLSKWRAFFFFCLAAFLLFFCLFYFIAFLSSLIDQSCGFYLLILGLLESIKIHIQCLDICIT